jgi:phosphatidylcholine synthase
MSDNIGQAVTPGTGEGPEEPSRVLSGVPDTPRASGGRRLRAWGVHLFTGLGLVLAGAMAVLIVEGTDSAFRWAFGLMIAATVLDATDGPLARRFRVQEVLPRFNGRRLDDIVDFHTFTSLPLLLVWRSGVLPDAAAWVLFVPLLASAYGFSREDAKTTDGHFLGFPSYWNVVAFYLYFLEPPHPVTITILLAFSGLTMLPWRYLKPGKRGRLELVTLVLSMGWGVVAAGVLTGALEGTGWVVGSLFLPAWYLGASWTMEARARRGRRGRRGKGGR